MSSRSNDPSVPATARLIALTGGIGSGKSVVSQLLRVMGFPVYDCDERARWVMTHDALLRQQLIDRFGADTYLPANGEPNVWVLNRAYLSSCIFADAEALGDMDACVHPAVARDLAHFVQVEGETTSRRLVFFESAILYESGFDQLSHPDEVWTVSAPLELRINRAMARDHAPREKILARINSQLAQDEKERRADHILLNDDLHSLIQQLHLLLPNSGVGNRSKHPNIPERP